MPDHYPTGVAKEGPCRNSRSVNANPRSRLLTIVLVVLLVITLFSSIGTVSSGDELTYSEFRAAVTEGDVETVTFTDYAISGEYREEAVVDGVETFSSRIPLPSVVGQDGIEDFLEEILQEHIVDESDVVIRAKHFTGGPSPAGSPSKTSGLARVKTRKAMPPTVPLQRLNSRAYDTTALLTSLGKGKGAGSKMMMEAGGGKSSTEMM